jgi:superfamily II DNA or RNA helicase
MTVSKGIPGFYIAWSPYLDLIGSPNMLHKVGFSERLQNRLHDSAYVTCFPPDYWRYLATLETVDAERLEHGVLHYYESKRIMPRELVAESFENILATAERIAKLLNISYTLRFSPKYEPCGGRQAASALPSAERWASDGVKINELMVPTAEAPPSPDTVIVEPEDYEYPAAPAATPGREEDTEFADLDFEADDDPLGLKPEPLSYREYQTEAAEQCSAELSRNGLAILQMACRCGKTAVAHSIIHRYSGESQRILYLVPGLRLLAQTAQKLSGYGISGEILLVGSQQRPVNTHGGPLTMTTDSVAIRAFLAGPGPRIVLSTYQSSPQIPTNAFDLTIFDEAHRTCGGIAARPFNHFIKSPRVGARLFMTATPGYDTAEITMKDRHRFGGVAYRYHLRRGIDAGYVNDFRLELIIAPATRPDGTPILLENALPSQIMAAMAQVDKLLVFCASIAQCTWLCEALRATPFAAGVSPFECITVNCKTNGHDVDAALQRFGAPGVRSVLFNCKMFQEGVELPALNGVFFATPKHSARDIIQSICRPLNAAPGKPQSVVFLPALHDTAVDAEDPANLDRFSSIVPFIDALLDEDPRLYDHLMDPDHNQYPIRVSGTRAIAGGGFRPAAVLRSARRAAHRGAGSTQENRLTRPGAVPWVIGFRELHRVVTVCGRYPKTKDALFVSGWETSMHAIYHSYRVRYRAYHQNGKNPLEPYQVAALDALPYWDTFGLEGPYPPKMCLQFLEQWLEEHGGVPPMLNIGREYIGLDASAMERLSGFLRIVNQQEGETKFSVPQETQDELDRICARFNLRWRRVRDAQGFKVKNAPLTFLQEATQRFKAHVAEHGIDCAYIKQWFDGYPNKHKMQENTKIAGTEHVPSRLRSLDKVAEDEIKRARAAVAEAIALEAKIKAYPAAADIRHTSDAFSAAVEAAEAAARSAEKAVNAHVQKKTKDSDRAAAKAAERAAARAAKAIERAAAKASKGAAEGTEHAVAKVAASEVEKAAAGDAEKAAAKDAEKAAAKAAKDAEKAAAKAAKDAEKAAAKAAKDAEKVAAKAAKDAEKVAAKAAKDAEKVAAKAAKDAEKVAAKAAKDAEKVAAKAAKDAAAKEKTHGRSK